MSVIEVVTFDDSVDSNDDRAEMVRPFVDAYRKAYYYRPGEPEDMIIGDMIANLMHLADRTPHDDEPASEDPIFGADRALDEARCHYDAEVEEERREDVAKDEERSHEVHH